jgi:hypothetical protein
MSFERSKQKRERKKLAEIKQIEAINLIGDK